MPVLVNSSNIRSLRNLEDEESRISLKGKTQRNPDVPCGILVVSVRPGTIAYIGDMLRRSGESIVAGNSVDQGWETLKKGGIGLVICDAVSVPADAVAMVTAARSSMKTAHVPFLFLKDERYKPPVLTPAGDEKVRDGWLIMPCQEQELDVMVTRLLQQAAYSRLRPGGSAVVPSPVAGQPSQQNPAPAAGSGMAPGVLTGRLGEIDVPKILSMLEPMGLTGTLTIKNDKHTGVIYLVKGAVWHAKMGAMEGGDALFLIFHITQGKFNFDAAEPPAQRTIQGSTMSLLLEGLRQMDETKLKIKQNLEERRSSKLNPPSTQS